MCLSVHDSKAWWRRLEMNENGLETNRKPAGITGSKMCLNRNEMGAAHKKTTLADATESRFVFPKTPVVFLPAN